MLRVDEWKLDPGPTIQAIAHPVIIEVTSFFSFPPTKTIHPWSFAEAS
jgi:hypothetical protein